MKLENARNKLLKAAGCIETYLTGYHARIGNYDVSFLSADGRPEPDSTVTAINVRRIGEKDDPHSDYFAGSYCRSLAEAIRWAKDWTQTDNHLPATR